MPGEMSEMSETCRKPCIPPLGGRGGTGIFSPAKITPCAMYINHIVYILMGVLRLRGG
jgi:hypothetical protein